jgi:hypothetical protein
MFLRNIAEFVSGYTALLPRRHGTVRIASSSGAFAPPPFNSLENGNIMETL